MSAAPPPPTRSANALARRRGRARSPRWLAAVGLLLACATGSVSTVGCERAGEDTEVVEVYAASSLREVAQAVSEHLEATGDVEVRVTVAGSQELRRMIEHGAPADLFLSADARHIDALERAGLVQRRVDGVVCNELVIAVPARDTATRSLADLADLERVVLGLPGVPVGRYADAVLDAAATDPSVGPDVVSRIRARVVSRESNTRQTLARVVLGEADAAIVYATDVALAGDGAVRAVPLRATHTPAARYPAAIVSDADSPDGASAWLDALGSEAGQAIVAAHGFVSCP